MKTPTGTTRTNKMMPHPLRQLLLFADSRKKIHIEYQYMIQSDLNYMIGYQAILRATHIERQRQRQIGSHWNTL